MSADQRQMLDMKRRLISTVTRAMRACFLGNDGKPTWEGERALRYLRKVAKIDQPYFGKDLAGRIDPVAMGRIEGRRELYLEIEKMLRLDPLRIGHIAEVDNARD